MLSEGNCPPGAVFIRGITADDSAGPGALARKACTSPLPAMAPDHAGDLRFSPELPAPAPSLNEPGPRMTKAAWQLLKAARDLNVRARHEPEIVRLVLLAAARSCEEAAAAALDPCERF